MQDRSNKNTLASVKRAAILIETLSHGPAGVREIAKLTNYDKSSVSRTLATLEDTGFVNKSTVNGKYMLTYRFFEIGNRSLSSFEYKKRLEPYLDELSEITGETILVGVLLQNDVLIIRKIRPTYPKYREEDIELASEIGYRVPIYNAALGKAILAYLKPEQRKNIIDNIKFKKTAKNTILSADSLLEDIKLIKEKGYSVSDEELKNGLTAVAAPFFNYRYEVIGSVAITGPTYRMSVQIDRLSKLLIDQCRKISADLGST